MQVVIITLGSRGDVQPYVALGVGLKQAGHSVRLVTSSSFATSVEKAGLEFAPLGVDFTTFMRAQGSRAGIESVRGAIAAARQLKPLIQRSLDDSYDAAIGADILIYHPKILAAPHIAEKLSMPAIISLPIPALSPTSEFPSPLLGLPNWSRTANRLSHKLVSSAPDFTFGRMLHRWRDERLGLSQARKAGTSMLMVAGRAVPRLYGFSACLVPRPNDWTSLDHITGYWFTAPDETWRPPEALSRFLEAGPPPVYIGFGSMVPGKALQRTQTIIGALADAGLRGILSTGWGGIEAMPSASDVCFVDDVPHDWLFPRVAAVVHHGGAGTTHFGLRHGRPTLICPVFGDQPFWGGRVFGLGLGPAPVPMQSLTRKVLARRLRELIATRSYASNAQDIGSRIRTETGISAAVEVVERTAASR